MRVVGSAKGENGTATQGAAKGSDSAAAVGALPFAAPSRAKAARLLRELGWGEHYIASEMNSSSGTRNIYLYSLVEAARFFVGEATGGKRIMLQRGMICWVDLESFISWISDVLGDEELADAIARDSTQHSNGFDQTVAMSALLNARVAQLRGIVDP